MRKAVRLALALLVVLGLQACGCATYSNRLWFKKPRPDLLPLDQGDFEKTVNKKLPRYARVLGLVSTPFKRAGIFGWRDMGMDIVAVGTVQQSAWSTDYFVTVDLELQEVVANGQPVDFPPNEPRFLRAEICERQLGLPGSEWPCEGDKVRITGRLLWDGDGFLEVHPQTAAGVEILERASCYTPCPMSRTTTTTRTTSSTPLAPCR